MKIYSDNIRKTNVFYQSNNNIRRCFNKACFTKLLHFLNVCSDIKDSDQNNRKT